MDPTGKSPNQILKNEFQDISSWHFFQAISWLDYAKRENSPSAIQLAAFELRYGIEYLLFELMVLSSESISEKEYEQCLGKPDKMKKMLNAHGTNYMKLTEFCKVLLSVKDYDLKIRFWDINELFRYWGIASSYLHFVGVHVHTFRSEQWIIKGIVELDEVLSKLWEHITSTTGHGIMRPSMMVPEVRSAWIEFSAGEITREELQVRMRARAAKMPKDCFHIPD